MGKAFGYVRLALINLFYVLVVLFVFSRLQERGLTIIVSILGMLYVTVRAQAILQGVAFVTTTFTLAKSLDELKAHHGDVPLSVTQAEYNELRSKLDTDQMKAYISGFFLGVISLICLFELFSAL